MNTASVRRALTLVTAFLLTMPALARGEQPRLERVLVLPVAGRVSVVLEMSGAPGSVSSRRISSDLFEVDAGPARVDRPQAFAAPSGTTLISTVVIDSAAADSAQATVRARITLRESCETAVRIQGNRVYVDISAIDGGPAPQARTAVNARAAVRAPRAAAPAAAADDDGAVRAEVKSALSRFGELLPFVTSAASAPGAQVLSALATPLANLDRSVRALPAPESVRPAEGLLASAIAAASKAIDPAYLGDRVEQVRQAAIFFQQAKVESDALDGAK